MTARDSAEGLGGVAARLAADANKVYLAEPPAIADLGRRFTGAGSAAADSIGRLDGSVKQLDGAWQGASSDAFVGYMATFGSAGTALNEALVAAASDLSAAASGVQGAREALEGMFGELYDNAVSWMNANPEATAEEKRQYVDGLAGAYTGRVREQLDQADQAVDAAATTLKGRLAAVDPKFSAMPDPDGQAFTPGPGRTIEWTPAPVEVNDGTTPSSAAPASAPPSGAQPATSGGGGGGGGGGGSDSGSGGGGGGGGSTSAGPSGQPPSTKPPGDVQEWIKQAIAELRAKGIPVSDADAQIIWEIIQHESSGNPNAINNWDSNAAKGTPSKGLMQTIDPTFEAYKLPGHDNIWNPVDNICAGVNYAIQRYGSLSNVPGIKATHGGGGYVGY